MFRNAALPPPRCSGWKELPAPRIRAPNRELLPRFETSWLCRLSIHHKGRSPNRPYRGPVDCSIVPFTLLHKGGSWHFATGCGLPFLEEQRRELGQAPAPNRPHVAALAIDKG